MRSRSPATSIASIKLNYAENVRKQFKAGILRSETESEQPHYTSAMLSASYYNTSPDESERAEPVNQEAKSGNYSANCAVSLMMPCR